MYRKSIYLIFVVLAMASMSAKGAITPITDVVITRVDDAAGAPNF